MVLVNGVELTVDSSLRALRTGLTHHGLSTSGPKRKCFARLLNNQKALELQTVHAAAEHAQRSQDSTFMGRTANSSHTFPMLLGAAVAYVFVQETIVMKELAHPGGQAHHVCRMTSAM